MLVRAFQVDVVAVVLFAQLRACGGNHGAADAGVDPHIQDVRLFLEVRALALGAGGTRGLQLLHGQIGPGFDALLLYGRSGLFEDVLVHEWLTAFRAAQHRDGRAPDALAADTPVRPARDHRVDAVAALGGHPLSAVDAIQTEFPQALARVEELVVHGDEPLLCGAEEDGRLRAPAVGIAVGQLLLVQQRADGAQTIHHQRVRIEDVLAFEFCIVDGGRETAIGTDELQQSEVMGQVEVVHAMIGGGMHQASARIRRYVIRQQHGALAVDPRMLVDEGLELDALADLPGVQFDAQLLLEGFQQRNRHDVVAILRLDDGVLHVGMHGDGEVARQRPGRGGPDREEEGRGQFQLLRHLVFHREGDRDR